jgi:uncharacterized Zn-finger protein
MNNGERTDSRDESGQHPTGDVLSDIPSEGGPTTVPDRKVRVLCPYCGRGTLLGAKCEHCKGLLDPLSRQATQNSMGPWFIHDPANPYRPGCSYEVIREMIRRGKINDQTILRGPTTRQYWMLASRVPSVANLLGHCHNCQKAVDKEAVNCPSCSADFSAELDRQFLGLGPVYLLPGQASPEEIARTSQQANANSGPHHAATTHAAHATHASHGGQQRPAAATVQAAAATTQARPTAAKARAATAENDVTGEYRALLSRMERVDRDLSNTRIMLGLSGVAVAVLAGAVLYFSGVFNGAGGTQAPLTSSQPGGSGTSQPASIPAANAGRVPAESGATTPRPANAGATPEELPTDLAMPPDPDNPESGVQPEPQPESQPETQPQPQPAVQPGTAHAPQPAPQDAPRQNNPEEAKVPEKQAPTATAAPKVDNAARATEWSVLRGLP